MGTESIPLDAAIGDPSSHFRSPMEIVKHPDLQHSDKLKLLRAWETDAIELETASEENMAGGEPSRLREVKEALRKLTEAS